MVAFYIDFSLGGMVNQTYSLKEQFLKTTSQLHGLLQDLMSCTRCTWNHLFPCNATSPLVIDFQESGKTLH